MHLRRAVLLFALVLGLTALATAVAPTHKSADQAPTPAPAAGTPVPAPTRITMHAPPAGPARSYAFLRDSHVLVAVVAVKGGQAEIPKLGQTQAVGQGATAQFDLTGLAPGRYDVLFAPALGAPARIGTLVSR